MSILFSSLNNKVYVCGQIISHSNEKNTSRGYESGFVLAVRRCSLPLTYNRDDYNYFFCSINENLVGGQNMEKFSNFRQGEVVEVYGILDTIPFDLMQGCKTGKRKAIYNYTSVIDVINVSKYKATDEEKARLNKELYLAKKIFGTSYDINFSEDAFDRDEDGLTGGIDIPNI